MFAIHRFVRRTSTFTKHNLTHGSIVIPVMSCKKNTMSRKRINNSSLYYVDTNSASTSRVNNDSFNERAMNTQYFNPNQVNNTNLVYNPYHGFTSSFGFSTYACTMNVPIKLCTPQNLMYRSFSETSVVENKSKTFIRQNSDSAISNTTRIRKQSIPSLRHWEIVKGGFIGDSIPGYQFTLMTYNVLAQELIENHPYLYKDHNKPCLEWSSRWEKLYREIKHINPDIICLQEVQESHIDDYYQKLFYAGYNGLYKKRTRNCPDGCAIYYKHGLLSLVENITVEYHQPESPLLNRDNIAIIAKFAPKIHPNKEFIVATTHLLYNPKREDVRLAQVQILMTEIDRIAFKTVINGKDTYLPTIITGDLNTPPRSTVYRFITQGSLSLNNFRDFQNGLIPASLKITDNCQHAALLRVRKSTEVISRSEEFTMIELSNSDHATKKIKMQSGDDHLFSSGKISHNFPLKSVYSHFKKNANEATTYQDKWLTVDYIFYSGKKENGNIVDNELKLLQKYKLPLDTQLGYIRIPNSDLGSDHLSLAAKFKLVF